KSINTGLCPGGRVRLSRMLSMIETGRVDPTKMTTHRFSFDEVEQAFDLMASKEDDVIKPLVEFS
ncbi:MAG: NAD(P)-dependent alcohol dehydrogenase, partial [bacterium]